MNAKALRWGLLSTARINQALIPAIRGARGNSLEAVASRSQNAAEVFAREWSIPRAHGSYADLLADNTIIAALDARAAAACREHGWEVNPANIGAMVERATLWHGRRLCKS